MDITSRTAYIGPMELSLLRTFVAVTEEGGFTAASRRLEISQPAVSRRIQHLEERFGTSLFDRNAEPISVTPAGMALLKKARRILEIESELEHHLGRFKGQQRIRLVCTSNFGTENLPGILESFVSAHEMVFDLDICFQMPEEILDGLAAGRVDLAVVEHCEHLDLGGYPTHALSDDEMEFVSAPELGLESEAPFEQLTRQKLYLKAENSCAQRFLRQQLHRIGRDFAEFQNVSYYDDMPGIVRQVAGGRGIGFLSREIIGQKVAGGALRIHKVAGLDGRRRRTLIHAPQLVLSPDVAKFMAVFLASFGVQPNGTLQAALGGLK